MHILLLYDICPYRLCLRVVINKIQNKRLSVRRYSPLVLSGIKVNVFKD